MTASDYQKLRQAALESLASSEVKVSKESFIFQLKNWFQTNQRFVFVLGSFGVVIILFFKVINYLKERFGPLPKGYQRCPKCRKVILKVGLECFHCGKRFKTKR
jgi:hypothetical protein